MSLAVKLSLVLSALVLTLGIVACDFNPTAPFEGFDGQASRGMVGSDGATLHGTFMGSRGSANALRAFAATATDDLIVVVYDSEERTEIGRVEVVDGRFTLRGLPESFTLEFWDGDKKVGERSFDGVKPNQEIDIVLEYEDGVVDVVEERRTGIDHEPGDGIEIEGPAENISWEDDPMTGSLDVNEWHVVTQRAQTSIRKGNRSLTLENLTENDRVHVRGVVREGDDGLYVFAYEIKLQEEEDDDSDNTISCPPDAAKPGHILICHKGKVLSVSEDAWPGHQSHGDVCADPNATPGDTCGS
jgi:hypothetical protein